MGMHTPSHQLLESHTVRTEHNITTISKSNSDVPTFCAHSWKKNFV